MKQNQQHIIDKVFVEVNISDRERAFSIKDHISTFLENEVFPGIEVLFDELGEEQEVLRFEKMEINLTVSGNDFFAGLTTEIAEQIKKSINEPFNNEKAIASHENKIKSESMVAGYQKLSVSESKESVFFSFLENGFLPWYAHINDLLDFTDEQNWKRQIENTVFVAELFGIFTRNEIALKRFVYQFPQQIVKAFLVKTNALLEREISETYDLFDVFTSSIRIELLFWVTKLILSETDKIICSQKLKEIILSIRIFLAKEELKEASYLAVNMIKNTFSMKGEITDQSEVPLNQKVHQKESPDIQEQGIKDLKSESVKVLNEGKVVENAGLIILHPFLKPFFAETGVVNQKGFIEPGKYEKAVQALHFLATGKEGEWEALLVFEKFLCGLPFEYPLLKASVLTKKIKKEAVLLLQQVISYWPALKNTSPDGLRQMFLQRRGKLIKTEKGFRLIMERKAQDILLDSLDWNIAISRMPFGEELIYTEW